jgi:N-acetylglutamate synthase-like GNAT family acetyltransferase
VEIRYQLRRATLDDLTPLKALWEVARQPVTEWEKRLTQFQIVERSDGILCGAFGFRAAGFHGLLFGEAFHSRQQAVDSQAAVWERLEALCRTQGVARLWLRGEPGPVWHERGFRPAENHELKRLPPDFAVAGRGPWWTLVLRDEDLLDEALKREMAQYQAEQQARQRQVQRSANALKALALLIAFGLFAAAMVLLFMLTGRRQRKP